MVSRCSLLCYKLTICLILVFFNAYSQRDFKNALYGEIGGNAGYYSINYERMLSKQLPIKAGISFLPGDLIITTLAGKLFGKSSKHFELMSGITYGYYHKRDAREVTTNYHELFGTAFIGYRYQRPADRLLFRIGYTPFFKKSFSHGAGISLGYRF